MNYFSYLCNAKREKARSAQIVFGFVYQCPAWDEYPKVCLSPPTDLFRLSESAKFLVLHSDTQTAMKIKIGRKRKERILTERARKRDHRGEKIGRFVGMHDSNTLQKEWRSQNG
jgi:hypothetical protein